MAHKFDFNSFKVIQATSIRVKRWLIIVSVIDTGTMQRRRVDCWLINRWHQLIGFGSGSTMSCVTLARHIFTLMAPGA